jgi:beta-phosphoglucomutase
VANSNYDAILFDYDGVLADSEPIHYRCWSEILSGFGIAIDWDTYVRECVGVADLEMLENLSAQWPGLVSVEQLTAIYSGKRDRFLEMMMDAMPFAPGLDGFLKSLSDYPLAVVTSSGRSEVEPVLEAAGLRGHFDVLVCGREAGVLKPKPDPYLKAAASLGVRNPLVVEDSDAGAAAGAAAGFDVVRIQAASQMMAAVAERLGIG